MKKEIDELKVLHKARIIFIFITFILSIINMMFIHSTLISGVILGVDILIIVELAISSYIINRNSKILLERLRKIVKENSKNNSDMEE